MFRPCIDLHQGKVKQIVGGSLGGGVASSHGGELAGYRIAYLVFTGIAIVAALMTAALASRKAELADTTPAQ